MPINEIVAGLVTLLAAYLGAHFAFRFQNEKAERDRVEEQVAAANRAIYTVYDIWNMQKQFQKERIDSKRGENAWFEIQATLPGVYTPIAFDVNKLDFLLSGGKPEIYVEMLQEEKRYGLFLSIVDERSRLMLEKVRPCVEALGVGHGDMVRADVVEAELGIDCVTKLKSFTNDLIANTDENLESLENLYVKLTNYLKELFPKEKFITVKFSNPDQDS